MWHAYLFRELEMSLRQQLPQIWKVPLQNPAIWKA